MMLAYRPLRQINESRAEPLRAANVAITFLFDAKMIQLKTILDSVSLIGIEHEPVPRAYPYVPFTNGGIVSRVDPAYRLSANDLRMAWGELFLFVRATTLRSPHTQGQKENFPPSTHGAGVTA
jgi:hypothetical protein